MNVNNFLNFNNYLCLNQLVYENPLTTTIIAISFPIITSLGYCFFSRNQSTVTQVVYENSRNLSKDNDLAHIKENLNNENELEPSNFPFFTLPLPAIDDNKEMIKKTGLSSHEVECIEHYVQQHESDWKKLSLQETLRIPKEESKLPRTIHVFRAYGRLCVQILCKRKNNLKIIGQGQYKKVQTSVEWRTKTLWVEYMPHVSEGWKSIQEGLDVHDKIECKVAGIYPSPQGRLVYENKGSTKYSFFGPLRSGDGTHYLKEMREQKISVCHQLLSILCILEKKDILHHDIRLNNLFVFLDENKQIHVELADFDQARQYNYNVESFRELFFSVEVDETKKDFWAICTCLEAINPPENYSLEIKKVIEKLKTSHQQSATSLLAEYNR